MILFIKIKTFSPLLLCVLLISIILGLRRSNFLLLWIRIEINIVRFVGLLCLEERSNSEAPIKYLIVQARGSFILLSAVLCRASSYVAEVLPWLLCLRAMLKLRLPPFHLWALNLCERLRWNSLFLFIRIQKILPLILSYKSFFSFSLLSTILVTRVFLPLSALSSTRVKKLFMLSSGFNLAWILLGCERFYLLCCFFIFYCVNLAGMSSRFQLVRIIRVSSLRKQNMPPLLALCVFGLFLNISGLPPFVGFFIKIGLLIQAIVLRRISLALTLFLGSGILIAAYFRMITFLSYNSTPSFGQTSTFSASSLFPLTFGITFFPCLTLLYMYKENFEFSALTNLKYINTQVNHKR